MTGLLSRLGGLSNGRKMALAALVCALTALLATPLRDRLDPANIVMLFLLAVLLVAVGLGRGAAVLAAFLSVILFDVFFVPPRFSLAVQDTQYLVTFAVMLATALIAGHLTTGLRRQAEIAAARERQTRALYEMARQLAGALTTGEVAEITRDFLRRAAGADGAILLPDAAGALMPLATTDTDPPGVEPFMARLAFDSGTAIDASPAEHSHYASLCLPLRAPMRMRGVLAVRPLDGAVAGENRALLEACASLVAIAIERLHYVEVAQQTQLEMAAERLRNSILAALSHDLRTPLTALVGLADSLTLVKPALPPAALETAHALHAQAERLSGLVGNLLDMARLQAGRVTLRREWQPVEEAIGSAIKLLESALTAHPVRVVLAPDLPLLDLDAVLMERVFCNLLDNAARHSPAGTEIEITAARRDGNVDIMVCDRGRGLPADKSRLFGLFVREAAGERRPAVGLGLAICRAIVEAHGGAIEALDREGGGACFRVSLPIGTPPSIEDEADRPAGDAS